MRLFISISVPKELHSYLRKLQSQFPDMKNTNEFHMTVQFLGDDIEYPDQLIETLKKIQFTPFKIEMGDAMPFGNPSQPRGVWIECKMTPELKKLSDNIRQTTSELGYVADKPFKAHITLGRYKRPPNYKPAKGGEQVEAKKTKGEPHKFIVEEFYLMESILTPAGAKHKILASFPNQ